MVQEARTQGSDVGGDSFDFSPSWQGRSRFVIFSSDFKHGLHFLSIWAKWLTDPHRSERLNYMAVLPQPPERQTLVDAHAALPAAQTDLTRALHDAWVSLTPGMHNLTLQAQGQSIVLSLFVGSLDQAARQLAADVDHFHLGTSLIGEDAVHGLPRLARLATMGAHLEANEVSQANQAQLRVAGFQAQLIRPWRGIFAPRHVPAMPAGAPWPEPPPSQRHALVIGAGLAGCVATHALRQAGWRVTLIDSHEQAAQEASGNPGGLFHSILHGEDGVHARAHRAGALATWRQTCSWIEQGLIQGQAQGLLRLDPKIQAEAAHKLLRQLNMPAEHVRWLDQTASQALASCPVPSGGWLYAQAGWLHPAGYCRQLLNEAHALAASDGQSLHGAWGRAVKHLTPTADAQWQALSANGEVIAQAPYVVLANAHAANELLQHLPETHAVGSAPLSKVRGQISSLQANEHAPHVTLPNLPVAGSGYVLPLPNEQLLFGATTQHHDDDPSVREADHRHNVQQATRLGCLSPHISDKDLPANIQGRTNWRALTPDRLPLIGPLPWAPARLTASAGRARLDQVRHIPRERTSQSGLYILSGLGSRGITWTALAGQILSHWMTGAPCPVEADLRDAMDPARFVARAQRQ